MQGINFKLIENDAHHIHYIWVHANETTARDTLLAHMQNARGCAFLIENHTGKREIPFFGGVIDPNRMFSLQGAKDNLLELNGHFKEEHLIEPLASIEEHLEAFIQKVRPPIRWSVNSSA